MMFNITLTGENNKPTECRINYSICTSGNKIFIYGGINEKNQILGSMEVFDCQTYKFTAVKYRGDYTPKARQAHAAIAIDKYLMLVIGGSL